MITADTLSTIPSVSHAFFTREGGISEGIYASLNCGLGSRDRPAAVARNRTLALEKLGAAEARLVTAYQVHSPEAVVVERPWARGDAPKADGMVSRTPGVVLGILTADCAPVLMADAGAGVIGAAHAGWRGARHGILEATLAAMEGLGAARARIATVIGPCIHQRSYEVGPEFHREFLGEHPANACYFVPSPRAGRFLFDLPGYAAARLDRAGVGSVERVDADTCADEARFFSYRRATLRGEDDYGRGLSAIGLRA